MSRYNRTNFYEKNVVDGILEYDLINTWWSLFKIKTTPQYFTVAYGTIGKLDLVSYRYYNTTDLWWIIAKINNIEDVWNDYKIGDVLTIPDINDIQDWYLDIQNAKRNR